MNAGSKRIVTVVLTGTKRSCAFNRGKASWYFSDGQKLTFRDLKAKNPEPCLDLVCKFLDAPDHIVLTQRWDRDGKVLLKEVKSDLKAVFKSLFRLIEYDGVEPIVLQRTDGYRLLAGYVKDVPEWLSEEGPYQRTGKKAQFWVETEGLPPMRWVRELISLVAEGKSAHVKILPGNGAEQVHSLLEETFDSARIIDLDLTWLDSPDEVLSDIAERAGGLSVPPGTTGRPELYPLVKAVLGSRSQLGLVVEGLGAFAQQRHNDSLKGVAKILNGLSKLGSPPVSLVLLSPTPPHHFLPQNLVGSFLTHLEPVFPSDRDCDELVQWARAALEELSANEIEQLLENACCQLGAVLAAMRTSQGLQSDRLRAIDYAHKKAGQSILGSVAPCCRQVLTRKTPKGTKSKAACVKVLMESGILDEQQRPSIEAWTASWGDAWRVR